MRRRSQTSELICARCGNADDLEVIEGARFCAPCRTCPHGETWHDSWSPVCSACVLDLHTVLTLDGPRIRNVDEYLADIVRYRTDTLTHTFEERERIGDRATYGDGQGVMVPQPIHFINQPSSGRGRHH